MPTSPDGPVGPVAPGDPVIQGRITSFAYQSITKSPLARILNAIQAEPSLYVARINSFTYQFVQHRL